MNEFLKILKNKRLLETNTKELSIEELDKVESTLDYIIMRRKEDEMEKREKERLIEEKIEKLRPHMMKLGLGLQDLKDYLNKPKKNNYVTYKMKDSEGKTHIWKGVGRMPSIFKAAIKEGKSLTDYAVNKNKN